MGRSAHATVRLAADDHDMDQGGILHRIEDDLAESWIAEWAGRGVDAIEVYLAKHLAFLTYLDRDEASAT
jgi:hypothetical protein